jgi:cell division protein FtsN
MKRSSSFTPAREQGGTLAGLLVGLIIGLLVAVGVAMTIMKSPLPFVDKLGKQAQPAGELGDPNKTLPGGARERRERMDDEVAPDAALAPAPTAAKKPAEAVPSTAPSMAPSTAVAPSKDGSAAARNDKAATAAPANPSASAAVPAAPAASAASAGDAFTYYLQAGAFREQADAEATKARLAMMGVAATIAERKSEIGTLYRVRVGPFADVEAMNRARVRLSDNGVDAAVVRVPK